MTDSEDSNLQPRIPCYPFAKVSHCCSSIDYCLSNGLCLDAGGDGLFTLQGCTDPNWPVPCYGDFNSCSQEYDYIPLWMCRSGPSVASWCCGNRNEARCCVDALVENKSLVEIPSPDAAFHPHALTGTEDAGDDKSSDGSGSVDKLGVGAAIAIGVLGLVLACN